MKIDLITGFLGSGKTTFLLQYGRYLMDKGLRIGILEYDYGAINSDMALLSELRGDRCELEMVAAACDADCLNRRFRTKLISMAMSGYDRVVVEPSGVFDMDMFFDALREDPLERWYEIGNIITIVDADLQEDMTKEEEFILASQAACAGRILLSRTQLVSTEKIEATKAHIAAAAEAIHCRGFRPKYVEKNWADLTTEDFDALFTCGYQLADYTKVIAGLDSDFSSVSFIDVQDNLSTLAPKIEKLFSDSTYGEIVRIKGFIEDNGTMYQVNATRHKTLQEPLDFHQKVLIVIGKHLDRHAIQALIDTKGY